MSFSFNLNYNSGCGRGNTKYPTAGVPMSGEIFNKKKKKKKNLFTVFNALFYLFALIYFIFLSL